jgi:hypothetical protein
MKTWAKIQNDAIFCGPQGGHKHNMLSKSRQVVEVALLFLIDNRDLGLESTSLP